MPMTFRTLRRRFLSYRAGIALSPFRENRSAQRNGVDNALTSLPYQFFRAGNTGLAVALARAALNRINND